jgi:pimeloyl-ACP methyl ester carboxylesterase
MHHSPASRVGTARALGLALSLVLAFAACARKEEPAAAPPAPVDDRPAEGAARIAIAPDGVHVQYHVYGTAEPALVFIHGWGCDSNYWREQIPAFKARYTLVTVDLAGHGGTDANRSEWTMARFGQDVATVLATIPNQKLILVGHSMGGPVAIEAARLVKDRVVGIIGVDTFKTIGAPVPSKPQTDAIVKRFEADFIGQTRAMVAERFFAPGANETLKGKVAYDLSLTPQRVGVGALRAALEYDFTGPLEDVSVPIVAINSDLGEPVNEARIRKVLPKFRAVTLAGDGHFLMLEDPARFNPALETEIQALLAAGS